MCIRISIQESPKEMSDYCKILKDLGEYLIYISENWVTHKSENIREVQNRLSRAVGFIIYFLHKEIRSRKDE
jgi:hypothetical protein